MISLGADASVASVRVPFDGSLLVSPAAGGPYIDSQRDNKAFGYADGTIFLSEDNGRTWPHSLAFPDAQRITFSHILKNGNILFATGSKLYLSTDNLKTYQQITVKAAGRLGLPPAHAAEPGQPRLVLPHALGRHLVGRERRGDAGVGELLQRPGRRNARSTSTTRPTAGRP